MPRVLSGFCAAFALLLACIERERAVSSYLDHRLATTGVASGRHRLGAEVALDQVEVVEMRVSACHDGEVEARTRIEAGDGEGGGRFGVCPATGGPDVSPGRGGKHLVAAWVDFGAIVNVAPMRNRAAHLTRAF